MMVRFPPCVTAGRAVLATVVNAHVTNTGSVAWRTTLEAR